MAKNIAGYISNLGKSVAYSAVDKVKNMSPTTAEFATNNAELFKSMYSNIRDYRGTYTRGLGIIKKSKIYEAADLGMKSVFEDIRTGKFYNKEREDRIASKIMGFDSDSFGSTSLDMDDSEFNMDDFNFEDEGISTGDKAITASILDSSRSNAEMISMSVARSAQQVVETQKASTHLLYTQNLQAYNIFNSNLAAMNNNISNILNFSTTTLQTQAQNATKYYQESTKLLQDQTALLRQILEAVSPTKEQIKQQKQKVGFSDIVGVNGTPDLKEYIKLVKKNLGDQLGAVGAMNSMFGEDSNALLSLVSSPLKFIPNMLVNKVVPKTVEKAFGEFDKSLSGFFGSLISKFNTMAKDEENIFTSTIGKIFGIKNNIKSSIDTSNYNKGKVDWDGKSRKALVEVIPTQLAKIVSLLSGNPEKIYDYDKGAFVDSTEIKGMLQNIRKNNSKRATSDMKDVFDKYMKNLTFSSLNEKETLEEDIQKFFSYMYENGEMFDMFGKNSKQNYIKYGINSKSYAIIKAMFKNADKHLQHSINKDIIEYRDKENREMMEFESKADSVIQYLFNNSNLGEFEDKKGKILKTGLLDSLDNKGKNIFFYLQNIYKELSYIRQYGFNGGGTKSGTIITGDDNYSPDIDSIYIKDTSKSDDSDEAINRRRNIARFEREEKRRRSKNPGLINFSNIDDERELENILSSSIKMDKFREELSEKDERKKTIIDRLLEAENISGKVEVVVDNLNRLTKKPMDFIVNTLNKVDQRMYEVIYGKESSNGDVKGFIDVMVLQLKNTFGKFNLWLDEEVLTPLRDKLNIKSISDIGKKLLEGFGIDTDSMKESIRETLFGKDSLFQSIKDSVKGTFKAGYNTVKSSLKDAYGPLFNSAKTYFQGKNKFTNLDDVAENFEEANGIIDWSKASKEQIAAEAARQRSLKGRINSGDYLSRPSNMYKGFNFDYSKNSRSSYRNHLYAEIKNSQFSNMSRREKELLLENLTEQYTAPGSSLYGMISRLQYELSNEDKINNLDMLDQKEDSLRKIRTAREFGRISINEDYFNRPKKSAQELYEMFPGLVSSPEIGEAVRQYNNQGTSNLYNSIFDKVVEGLDYLKSMKDSLIQIVQSINPRSNTGGFTKPSVFNSISTPFSSNPLVREEDMAIDNFAKELGGIISGSIANYIRGNTKKYASGGYVDQAQVATIGRGEVVLSKEDTENFVGIISNLMDNLSGKNRSKLANNMYKNPTIRNLYKKLGGLNIEDVVYGNKGLHAKYNSLSDDNKSGFNRITSSVLSQLREDENAVVDSNGLPVDPVKRAAFEEAKPYIQKVGEEFTKGVSSVRNALFGDSEQTEKKSFGLFLDDTVTNITKYAPEAIGSGLLGAGVSLLTGAIGGPLLGAAIGAGISLTKNSEKAQEWLFGEKDEEGNRKGGVIPKNFLSSVTKYLPDLKTYGIAGAATGLLPLVPFGPVGGLLLGSGIAFAKKNEAIQEALFGESDGLFKPETKNKIKKMLPRVGLGVAGSLMFGPFGFLGNALLGSGLGMLSTTDKFQELVLGIKDKEGKYQGGLLPTLRDTVVDPIKGYLKGIGSRVTTFIDEHMLKPLKSAFAPMKKTVELMTKGMFDKIGDFMNNMFEKSFGVPLNKLIEEKIIKPVTGFIGKWIFKPLKGAAKFAISSPFKAIGALGNSLRKKHIRDGNADYMTAAERLQFRKDKNIYTMGLFGNDKFFEQDQALAGMDDNALGNVIEQLQNIRNDEKTNLSNRMASAKDMAQDILPHFKYTESKNIMKYLKQGKIDEVVDYIQKNPKFNEETKQRLISSLREKYSLFQKRENKRLSDINNKQTIFEQLRKQGINVNDKNINKYLGLLDKEKKNRNKNRIPEEEMTVEEKQLNLEEKNHVEIVDLMREIIDTIKGKDSDGHTPIAKSMAVPNIVQQIDDDGTVRRYKYNRDGELVPDKNDPVTTRELRQEQKEESTRMTFYERLSNMASSGKEKLVETAGKVKEGSRNLLSGLGSLIGGASKFLSIGGLIATGLMAFMKTPDGQNMLFSVAKKVGGWFTGILGNGIKAILPGPIKKMLGIDENYGEGGLIDNVSKSIGYEGASDVGGQLASTGMRQILTGNSLKGGKVLGKMFKSKLTDKGLFGKAFYMANPVNLVKETGKFGGRMVGRAVDGLGKLTGNLYEKTGISKFKDMILQKGATKATSAISSLSKTAMEAAQNSDLIQSMIRTMKEFMEKLFTNKTVVAILGDKADAILKKFVPTVMKEITERASKASTKAITKVIGGLSTGGLLNVLWAAADFVSGFNDCKNILEIVQEPTFGMKVSTGIIKALNGLFIVTSFIPEKTWVRLVLDIIMPIFGKEDTDIQKMREESKKIVEDYSTKNGKTTIEEYNKKNKKGFIRKITDGAKSIWNSTKNMFSSIGNKISGAWGNFTDWIGIGGKGPSVKYSQPNMIYTGKGCSTGCKRPSGKTYYGKGVSESDIKYMELNAPIEKKITAADINKWVNPIVGGSDQPFYNIGDIAMKAQQQTGLDARYLVAHAAQESGWGRSHMAKTKHNFFGIGAFNDSPDSALSFSKENGFIEGAKWINHNFTKHGQNTLYSMINADGHRYAVFDDGSPNTHWMNNIANIMYNSGLITSGSINKNATWDGQWADGNYGSSGSSAKDGTSTATDDASGSSIFNAFTELGTALSNDFNRIFGFDPGSSDDSSSGTNSSSGASFEGEFNSKAGKYNARKVNGFTYFAQTENPWSSYIYRPSGGGMFSDPTVGERGCGTTSAAMVIRELTGNKEVDPASMADLSTDSGTSVEAGTAHSFFNIAGNKYGLNVRQAPVTASGLSNITKNTPMIINGVGGPDGRRPFFGGHFIVGVKGTKDSITVNDPFGESASKTYKISEILPYMQQGWTFSGGKGPSTFDKIEQKNKTYGKGPDISLPNKVTNIVQNVSPSSNNSSFEKILLSIVQILMKISDNSNYLSKIVEILSNNLGVAISDETKKSIKANSKDSKNQIVNVIKQSVNESNPDNEYLLNLLDSLATQ